MKATRLLFFTILLAFGSHLFAAEEKKHPAKPASDGKDKRKVGFIWDLDDTFHATTFVANELSNEEGALDPKKLVKNKARLDALDLSGVKLIRMGLRIKNAQAIVVTLANAKHIDSCRKLLPRTMDLLKRKGIDILSAHDHFDRNKSEAMQAFLGLHELDEVIAFGDAEEDMEEVEEATKNFLKQNVWTDLGPEDVNDGEEPILAVKRVKFIDKPATPEDLIRQHNKVIEIFGEIMASKKHQRWNLKDLL